MYGVFFSCKDYTEEKSKRNTTFEFKIVMYDKLWFVVNDKLPLR